MIVRLRVHKGDMYSHAGKGCACRDPTWDSLWTRRSSDSCILCIAHQKNRRQKGLYLQRVLGSLGWWVLRPTS